MDGLYQTQYGVSVAEPSAYGVYAVVLALIVALSLTVDKRGFCHTVCWMAPFMIIGTAIKNRMKWPSVHLRARTEDCIECGTCTRNCPMSLEVKAMVQWGSMKNSECILCGQCVDGCSKYVIRYSFGSRNS